MVKCWKIFPSEEHKQSKNHCSPVKLESKKHDKKVLASKNVSKNPLTPAKLESKKQDKKERVSREGSGGAIPSSVKKKPRPTYHRQLLLNKTGNLEHALKIAFSLWMFRANFYVESSDVPTEKKYTILIRWPVCLSMYEWIMSIYYIC